ncbi:MAG: hypothetical protein NTW87_21180 [Planctomycetota bacterium]|nr:hypothetical protein [Planctomycetota bacterium]
MKSRRDLSLWGASLTFAVAALFAARATLCVTAEDAPPPKAEPKAADANANLFPVPPAAMLADTEKEIKDLFKDEYQKKGAAERTALATKLLKLGQESKNDVLPYYVSLREARDVAASVGDLDTAFAAVDLLARVFAIDAADMKAGVVTGASRGAMAPEDADKALPGAIALLDQLVKNSQLDAAVKLAATLEELARRGTRPELAKTLQARAKEVRAQQAEWAKAKPLFDKLKENPDDPEVALGVARYYVTVKDDWTHALPLLAKCSVPALKEAAAKDVLKAEDATARADLGDLWWAVSEKETGPFKDALQDRAALWYGQALGQLTGMRKALAEKRIQGAAGTTGGGALSPLSFQDGLIRAIKLDGTATAVAFHPNGRTALVTGETGIHQYDLETGQKLKSIATPGAVGFFALSPDGRRVVAAGPWGGPRNGDAAVFDLATGAEQSRCKPGKLFTISAVGFYPDGRALLCGHRYEDTGLKILQVHDGKDVGVRLSWSPLAFTWNGDCTVLFLGYAYTAARSWGRLVDGRTGKELHQLKELTGVTTVTQYGLSRDGRLAFALTEALMIFDVATGKMVQKIQPEEGLGAIQHLVFFPDDRRIAAGCHRGTIVVWDIASGKVSRKLEGEHGVSLVDVSPDSRFVLAGGALAMRLYGVGR